MLTCITVADFFPGTYFGWQLNPSVEIWYWRVSVNISIKPFATVKQVRAFFCSKVGKLVLFTYLICIHFFCKMYLTISSPEIIFKSKFVLNTLLLDEFFSFASSDGGYGYTAIGPEISVEPTPPYSFLIIIISFISWRHYYHLIWDLLVHLWWSTAMRAIFFKENFHLSLYPHSYLFAVTHMVYFTWLLVWVIYGASQYDDMFHIKFLFSSTSAQKFSQRVLSLWPAPISLYFSSTFWKVYMALIIWATECIMSGNTFLYLCIRKTSHKL